MQLEEVSEQRVQYQRLYEEGQSAVYRYQEEVHHLQHSLALLTQQLSLSHQEREDSVYRAAK